jgi:hypothetical protein
MARGMAEIRMQHNRATEGAVFAPIEAGAGSGLGAWLSIMGNTGATLGAPVFLAVR